MYRWKLRLLKNSKVSLAWRYWMSWRGKDVGGYFRLPEHIREHSDGRSFADIGCMWGVNGAHSFMAEEAGASPVKAVDVFGPTPEFQQDMEDRNSSVEFILGDVTDPATLERIGVMDTVLCAGVLYHHPSPYDVLVALRRICRETLILRTSTIPEIGGLPHAAIYYPSLNPRARRRWDLSSAGVGGQCGITTPFSTQDGYGNWFWGISPSCLEALAATAGFRVLRRLPEPFAQTLICAPAEDPTWYRVPGEAAAREIGRSVSSSGQAHPA